MARFKDLARKLFSPLLDPLEAGEQPYTYTPRARLILWVVGILFLGIACGLGLFLPEGVDIAFLIPVSIFGLAGLFAIIVAGLGSKRAVAKVWGNRS
ncbi:MAG: hypothetical protein ACK4VV_06890 [Pseudomonas sp.]